MELALILKTLGDDIRIRILGLLLKRELCVCDIESILELSQVNASRHLARMKIAGILTSRKDAQWVYYTLNPKFIKAHSALIDSLSAELMKRSDHKRDIRKLSAVKKKPSETGC